MKYPRRSVALACVLVAAATPLLAPPAASANSRAAAWRLVASLQSPAASYPAPFLLDADGKAERRLTPDAVSVSPDGRWLAREFENGAVGLRLLSGGRTRNLGNDGAVDLDTNTLVWDTNSRAFFLTGNFGSLEHERWRWLRYDLSTGTFRALAWLPRGDYLDAKLCPNGRTAGVVDLDGDLSIVDAVTGRRKERIAVDETAESAGISWVPDCTSIFAAVTDAIPGFGPPDGFLERIDLPRPHLVLLATDDFIAGSPTVSPDGRYVFAVMGGERLVRGSTHGRSVRNLTPKADFVAGVSAGD